MIPYLDDGDVRLYHGDVRAVLAELPSASVDCVVTSPPYWQLRDYAFAEQIGLEPTIEQYVEALRAVFAQVRRVLAPHGTCWLNLGDSYASNGAGGDTRSGFNARCFGRDYASDKQAETAVHIPPRRAGGLKPKDLCLIPARVALALQADGWWVRQRNVWAKPNPMPESVTDRTTSAHEDVYMLTRVGAGYWYDAEAVREEDGGKPSGNGFVRPHRLSYGYGNDAEWTPGGGRNLRNVWTIATELTPEAHFATFPSELVRLCLAAGCPPRVCRECGQPSRRVVESDAPGERVNGTRPGRVVMRDGWIPQSAIPEDRMRRTAGWTDCGHDAWRAGIVLDPFVGSGKTAQQARRMGLGAVGIDGSAEYLGIAAARLAQLSLLAEGVPR